MAKNTNLHEAKVAKNDEFYTQINDIEQELKHYKKHFKNKVVLCNCDDPKMSNFYKFFAMKFHDLGLKKLICTCYKNDNEEVFTKNHSKKAVVLIYEGKGKPFQLPKCSEYKRIVLKGDGDFRSDECLEYLKEADIVVTNPPFSLFREYVKLLMDYDKKFLIIGNINAITYKEIFPLIRDNKMWPGYQFNKTMIFGMSDNYSIENKNAFIKDGKKYGKVPAIAWYTNMNIPKRSDKLILTKTYKGNEKEYPKYDNYDAIEVGKVVNIPKDYDGIMGVPITFLDKYNPDQFEIIALGTSKEHYTPSKIYNGLRTHKKSGKIIIGAPINSTLAIKVKVPPLKKEYYIDENKNIYIQPYARILIKRKGTKI